MAFGAQRIFPIDKQPRVAVGVSLPFNAPDVFNSTYLTKDAIRYNLINYLLTNTGERYENPNFGANLRSLVFSQISTGNLDFIKSDIQNKINIYFPSVIVDSINVIQIDENAINITINYSVQSTNITDTVEITFN